MTPPPTTAEEEAPSWAAEGIETPAGVTLSLRGE
jgi:hypothetical protein